MSISVKKVKSKAYYNYLSLKNFELLVCADSDRLWLWEVQPADKWHELEEQHVRDAIWSGVEDGKRQGQSDVPRSESGDEDDRIFQTESQGYSGLFSSVETILNLSVKEDGESLVAGRC